MKTWGLAVLFALIGRLAGASEGTVFYDNTPPFTTDPMVSPLRSDLPGLVNVEQTFLNGDHRIRRMFTYPQRPYWGNANDPALIFDIRDGNTDDPFEGHVRWEDLRQLAMRTTGGTCAGGTCRFSMPALPNGDTIVLMGWKLELTNGNEMNIRELAIVPNPQAGYIDVTFTDDGDGHPYLVTIYYARLVALEIQSINAVASTSSAYSSVTIGRPPGRAVLSGFRLRFNDTAHFLKRWSVELCPHQTSPAPCREDQIRLRFRDGDGAEGFDWRVWYTILRPAT